MYYHFGTTGNQLRKLRLLHLQSPEFHKPKIWSPVISKTKMPAIPWARSYRPLSSFLSNPIFIFFLVWHVVYHFDLFHFEFFLLELAPPIDWEQDLDKLFQIYLFLFKYSTFCIIIFCIFILCSLVIVFRLEWSW